MAIISCGFLPLKLTKKLDLAVSEHLTVSSKEGKKSQYSEKYDKYQLK